VAGKDWIEICRKTRISAGRSNDDEQAGLQERRLRGVHTSAKALRKLGAIDKATMRDFDVACLSVTAGPPIPPVKVNKGFKLPAAV